MQQLEKKLSSAGSFKLRKTSHLCSKQLTAWGQECEHLFSVAVRLQSDKSFDADVFRGLPLFYSETKFANHCAKVYEQLRKDYPALFSTLEET